MKKLKLKIVAVYLAFKHKGTPKLAKVMAGVTIAYALSPIDLIPDFIPVLGYLDDLIILPLLILICIKLIPSKVMVECENGDGMLVNLSNGFFRFSSLFFG